MPSLPFLDAEWRHLAMLNYRVDPGLLLPHVPAGTQLDTHEGHTLLSVVGFMFLRTRALGLSIPLHRDFEEVNLRFYVKREVGSEVRRAVTFLRELVPRRAVALVARLSYNEPYLSLPMRHRLGAVDAATGAPAVVQYEWKQPDGWEGLAVQPMGAPRTLLPGTEEAFVTEHYWGYTRQRDGNTMEYRVEHPPWRVWSVSHAQLNADLAPICDSAIAAAIGRVPESAFLADGSAVTVAMPRRIEASGVR